MASAQMESNPPDEPHISGWGGRGVVEPLYAIVYPEHGPVTMNLDETKCDRIPPMSRTFLGWSGAVGWPLGAKLGDFGCDGGAMYALISPVS